MTSKSEGQATAAVGTGVANAPTGSMRDSTTLSSVKNAYAMAADDALREGDGPLPAWEDLPMGYRQAFITVFSAGGRYWLDDFKRRRVMTDDERARKIITIATSMPVESAVPLIRAGIREAVAEGLSTDGRGVLANADLGLAVRVSEVPDGRLSIDVDPMPINLEHDVPALREFMESTAVEWLSAVAPHRLRSVID